MKQPTLLSAQTPLSTTLSLCPRPNLGHLVHLYLHAPLVHLWKSISDGLPFALQKIFFFILGVWGRHICVCGVCM